MDVRRLKRALFRGGVAFGIVVFILVVLVNLVGVLVFGLGWQTVLIGALWGGVFLDWLYSRYLRPVPGWWAALNETFKRVQQQAW